MSKVYVVMAYGGQWEESYYVIDKIFLTRARAEEYREHFLNSPELMSDYGDEFEGLDIEEWDAE